MFSRSHVLTRRNENDGTQKEDMENRIQPRRACTVRAESNRVNVDLFSIFCGSNEALRGLPSRRLYCRAGACIDQCLVLESIVIIITSYSPGRCRLVC